MPTNFSTKAHDISTYEPVSESDKIEVVSTNEIILKDMSGVSDSLKKKHLLIGVISTK